ncbi:cysteine proteinase [Dentipellis sp. KUC8613]|nr:cysteine proteinase [Dentipellis sp. KUC8613]
MPSVSVLPASPSGFGPSFSTVQNGSTRSFDDMSVAEIKEKAIANTQRLSKGVSAVSLIRSAKGQITLAHSCESAGDLKGALSAFTRAASLTQIFMDSAEFKAESSPGKKGILWREFTEFQQNEGSDMTKKAHALEDRLLQFEKTAAQLNGNGKEASSDGLVQKSGGSIADRMRSLQDAGMSVSTTKRISREIPIVPSQSIPIHPSSHPTEPPSRPHRNSVHGLGLSVPPMSPSVSASSMSPVPPPSAPATVHTFVSPSTLSPPSPSSSTSSSPRASYFNLSEFAQAFPSIDELEESDVKQVSAASTGMSGPGRPPVHDTTGERSPALAGKAFPVLPVDPGPRPSSTPITPVVDHFASRPASPSPRSPTIPTKLFGLAHKPSRSPLIPTAAIPEKAPLELPSKGSLDPRQLSDLLMSEYKVLLLDVRIREAYDREHIKADAVVCIEPSVLLRADVTGSSIEDSLIVAPRHEWVLFCNRDKFDVIVVYDDTSETIGHLDSPLTALVRAIYETAFRKVLKNCPVLLVGGIYAWKREYGDSRIGHTEPSPSPRLPLPSVPAEQPSPPASASTANGHYRPPPPVGSRSPMVGRTRSGTDGYATSPPVPEDRIRHSLDQGVPSSSRSPLETNGFTSPTSEQRRLARKPAISRPPSTSSIPPYSRTLSENISSPTIPQSMTNGSSIQYPQFARTMSPTVSGSSFNSSAGSYGIASPPQASINPSTLSRRRSTFVDQSQEALSGLAARPAIDYPELSSQHILRPPPVAASSGPERKDSRPRLGHGHSFSVPQAGPAPPTIPSDYPVTYWSDVQIGTSGLKNLGNTCYMNSTIQCLSATVPFARFFTDGRWKSAVNMVNPLGTKGNLAHAFASILHEMWHGEMPYISPYPFRRSLCIYAAQFSGSEQHDSQEFLSFLLDGLHEDLNRVLNKPNYEVTPEREAELEKLPQQIASEQEWKIYRMRNDSLVVDFFQGQFRNRMECMVCHNTSTTYNTFMYLSLPIPSNRHSRITIEHCLDAFVKEEVMEKSDAWNCPRCKTLRRATKQLSLSRLPPVLLIHLKRFSFKGPFTDKIEKLVEFPLKGLDLTNYMPPPLPPGVDRGQHLAADDPRLQMPPYRYDLYGVTNHFGSLSSGHYTAFIASRGGWMYCDDSRVTPSEAKEVVGRPAYVLYYKRVKP